MKVIIENLVVEQRIKGEIDPSDVNVSIKGCRFQPDVFKGLIYEMSDPHCELFLLPDGRIRVHGVRSMQSADKAIDRFVEMLRSSGFRVGKDGRAMVLDVTSSHDIGCRLDPKKVLEEFKDDQIIYAPLKLPGFSIGIPNTSIEILIFPEGKILSNGAVSVEDSASSLEMVMSRLSRSCMSESKGSEKGV